MEGIVEIVPNSTTLAKITSQHAGWMAAFSKVPLSKWLLQQNELTEYFEK